MSRHPRRKFLKDTSQAAAAASLAAGANFPGVSFGNDSLGKHPPLGKAEHCILVWLGGGAAQIDTWDPKPKSKDGHKDPGSAYESIPTAISGANVCEHLHKTAPLLDRAVLLRTLHHETIDDHAAAVNMMHIGRPVSGTVEYPSMGSVIAHLKGEGERGVPKYVLMGYPTPSRGPGFLGAAEGMLSLTDTRSGPKGLSRPDRITAESYDRRRMLLDRLRKLTSKSGNDSLTAAYDSAVSSGFELSGPKFMNLFELDREPADLRNSYGDEFGQRCLLARRLVGAGVRFVEVCSNLNFVNGTGWDTHNAGQKQQHVLIKSLDSALSTLLMDLQTHQLLDKTLVVVCSEFGRPGHFDAGGGRGHHSKAFSTVIAGGGLRTGQVVGETNEHAELPVERPVSVADLFATIYHAMGIDYRHELYAESRPVPISDRGHPITELFG